VVRTPHPPLISCAPSRSTGTGMLGLAAPPPSVAPFTHSQSHPLEPVVEFTFSPALCGCFSRRVWWPGSPFCVRRRNSGHLPARSHRAPLSTAACSLASHQDRLIQDRRTRSLTPSLYVIGAPCTREPGPQRGPRLCQRRASRLIRDGRPRSRPACVKPIEYRSTQACTVLFVEKALCFLI
jgi:hypothetical protein